VPLSDLGLPISDRQPAAMRIALGLGRHRCHAIIDLSAIARAKGAIITGWLIVKPQTVAQFSHHANHNTGQFPALATFSIRRCQAGFHFSTQLFYAGATPGVAHRSPGAMGFNILRQFVQQILGRHLAAQLAFQITPNLNKPIGFALLFCINQRNFYVLFLDAT